MTNTNTTNTTDTANNTATIQPVSPAAGAPAPSRRRGRIAALVTGACAAATLGVAGGSASALNPSPVNGNPDGASWTSMSEYLEFVLRDVDSFWTQSFLSDGYAEPWVNFQFPGIDETVVTACGPSDGSSMFYCPVDDTIVFSQDIATRLWDGSYVGPDGLQGSGGDFAVAFLVAHEMAHNIQNELGIDQNVGGASLELHADCWSGVWAQHAAANGLLEQGDIEEGLAAAAAVGDSAFGEPDHHGTGEQRQNAFWLGFNSTSPLDCDAVI